uniref:Uncharacterized protein n=1 Tax=Solanum tuberosum TaxID=4113 RepID=M1B799_SOLTU
MRTLLYEKGVKQIPLSKHQFVPLLGSTVLEIFIYKSGCKFEDFEQDLSNWSSFRLDSSLNISLYI